MTNEHRREPHIGAWIDEQMADALHNTRQLAATSHRIDRTRWTREQWIHDAQQLMDDPDGSIACLVNGHVNALLAEVRDQKAAMDRVRQAVATFCHGEQMYVEHDQYCVPILNAIDGGGVP